MSETSPVPPKKFELSPSLAIVVAGALIAASIIFVNLHPAEADIAAGGVPTPQNANIRAPLQSDYLLGSPDASIFLVEYSDFQCPFCTMIYPTLKRIVAESNGQIAWVHRNFPLSSIHPEAAPAANAAECIAAQLGNDGFWKFADAIFAKQAKLSADSYEQLAVGFGADRAAFTQCVSARTYQSKIDTDAAEAQSAGATGTPFTVVINVKTGKATPISGALPYEQVMSVIKSLQ